MGAKGANARGSIIMGNIRALGPKGPNTAYFRAQPNNEANGKLQCGH